MAEPTSSTTVSAFGLTSLFVSLLGPMAGPYALIAMCALAGAMWPLCSSETTSRKHGALLLLMCTLTAIALTAFFAVMLEKWSGVSGVESLPFVAFCIGAMGNGWRPIFAALGSGLAGFAGRFGGK